MTTATRLDVMLDLQAVLTGLGLLAGGLFALCLGLLWVYYRLDRDSRKLDREFDELANR